MLKTGPIVALFLLGLMNHYTFAVTETPVSPRSQMDITVAPNGKVIANTPDKPPHCVKGCIQPEDCRNNEPKAPTGYMWRCRHDKMQPGACNGTCEQIRIPKRRLLN